MGFGTKIKSGTPVETRGLSSDIAGTFRNVFEGGDLGQVLSQLATPLQRMSSGSSMNFLGFDPSSIGLSDALGRALNPDVSVLQPAEAQARSNLFSSLAAGAGSQGARFSGNLANAQALGGAELGNLFGQTRLGAVQNAGQLGASLLPNILGAGQLGQAGSIDLLKLISGFGAPGAPIVQQGWGSSLFGGLGALGGSLLGGPFGGALGGAIFGGAGK